ncbi:DUF2786 domain-containing protein [Roseomonas sp. M0104]|uniref:DUF2786 domain-containing protein n=1 Tax=Teichococcus coralli TaxID=2545983 RepID=A0A845BE09_9PROT|nr:DUF2786 domain-containing protein [Pseudoroseomonas coralli]MXP64356.1 DUF2786 domain-containing protein [Pseudoroseomonas coralli]
MNQAAELARVKARIRALTEKTVSNGCTEAEALAAAEMVGRLLERYALSMDEVELREARCIQVEVPLAGRRRRPVDACVPAIARFCDCKVWLAREAKGPHYVFFGLEPDTALASYLFAVVERSIGTELAGFRAARPALRGLSLRRASTSFQQGMAGRLAERLEAMVRERQAGMAARPATGTALVVAKRQVVEEAFREAAIRLVSSRRQAVRADGAYHHGYAAGDRVNLNRPVHGRAPGLIE